MPASDEFRARLIAARERLGLTRRQMAEQLLTPRMTYVQWETGARRTPGVAVVAAERLGKWSARKPRAAPRAPKRDAVLTLADGTRSIDEIAAQLGMSRGTVKQNIYMLRKMGQLPRVKSRRASVTPAEYRTRLIAARATREQVKACIEEGLSQKATIQRLGISKAQAFYHAKKLGMAFRIREPAGALRGPNARSLMMAAMYIDGGGTMQQIGEHFGLSRERVRQILAEYHNIHGPHYERRRRAGRAALVAPLEVDALAG